MSYPPGILPLALRGPRFILPGGLSSGEGGQWAAPSQVTWTLREALSREPSIPSRQLKVPRVRWMETGLL